MKYLITLITLMLCIAPIQARAGSGYDYQLYTNHEDFGIVVFPKKYIFKALGDYIASISFSEVESGKAVMRRVKLPLVRYRKLEYLQVVNCIHMLMDLLISP